MTRERRHKTVNGIIKPNGRKKEHKDKKRKKMLSTFGDPAMLRRIITGRIHREQHGDDGCSD